MPDHEHFMLAALVAALRGLGRCAPNPAVGAVVVRDGCIMTEGYHHGVGLPHAEVEALQQVDDAGGGTLYVTLEPCCHHGRTPPCTDLIIRSGISHVYFGFYDPNPQVAGKGQQRLIEAGIACDYFPLPSVDALYRAYAYWWRTRKPWVTLKLAISDQHHLAITRLTGEACQLYTQQQRLQHDALLTSVQTILYDDPQYSVRRVDAAVKKPLFIVDRQAQLPVDAKVLMTCAPITIFYHAAPIVRLERLQALGVQCIEVPLNGNRLDLHACLNAIARQGLHSVWVEAGWTLASSIIRQGLAHEILFYVAPVRHDVLLRTIEFVYEPQGERTIEFELLGDDLLISIL